MAPVEITCPNVGETTFVSTPEYCTVLKTLLAVARISILRVSPNCIVFESVMLFEIVPGPAIELREAVPNGPTGVVKAAVLNHFPKDPPSAVSETPGTRSGRKLPAVPRATSVSAAA
jgi:hypothetical protein